MRLGMDRSTHGGEGDLGRSTREPDFTLTALNRDLSRLGSGERNSAKPKAHGGSSEWARASHWAGARCRTSECAERGIDFQQVALQAGKSDAGPFGLLGGLVFDVPALTCRQRTGFVLANGAGIAHSFLMKTAEDVRNYATILGIAEEEAIKRGMVEKSKTLVEECAEVYAKS